MADAEPLATRFHRNLCSHAYELSTTFCYSGQVIASRRHATHTASAPHTSIVSNMTPTIFADILRKHEKWTRDLDDGVRADLTRAALSGLVMPYVNLRHAIATGADFSKCVLTGVNFSDAELCEVDLSRAYLADADFTGADLRGACLSEANLTGADFTGANLEQATLSGAKLSGAVLRAANLRYATLAFAVAGPPS